MAAFLDNCRFNPTLGGTTDWTYSSAVAGYQSPAAAGAVNGRLYKYFAIDGSNNWELGEGAYNTTGPVLARTTITANSLGTTAKINFAAAPQVAIVAIKADLLSVEEANSFTTAQKKQAQSNIFVAPTTQSLTSGTGATYTTPAGVTWLEVFMVGGGGGGSGITNTTTTTYIAGSAGGTSTFNSVNAVGGSGGAVRIAGDGGTGGTGTATRRAQGGAGSSGALNPNATIGFAGGAGGSSFFAGGARMRDAAEGPANGIAGAANTGTGGSGSIGGGTNFMGAPGGGAGEFVYLLITSPAATYTYTIGAGGGGGAGVNTSGGAGGSGFVFVVEHYGS